jgi:hypothetical protein
MYKVRYKVRRSKSVNASILGFQISSHHSLISVVEIEGAMAPRGPPLASISHPAKIFQRDR